jgi:hypothetical protein
VKKAYGCSVILTGLIPLVLNRLSRRLVNCSFPDVPYWSGGLPKSGSSTFRKNLENPVGSVGIAIPQGSQALDPTHLVG